MNSTDIRSVSILTVAGIFSATYVGLVILLDVAGHTFALVQDLAVNALFFSGAVPAILTAQYWIRREQAAPGNRRAWTYAIFCGAVSTALLGGLAAAGLLGDSRHPQWSWLRLTSVLVCNTLWANIGFSTVFSYYQPRTRK